MVLLQMQDVKKRYGGVRALDGASFQLEAGEIHGLLGPNGSGKSTLNKVLAGSVRPDRGTVELDGRHLSLHGPKSAYRNGIAAVYQQLSLASNLTVGENVVLGNEPLRAGLLSSRSQQAYVEQALAPFAAALGEDVTSGSRIADLSPGQQQLVEIAKAVARKPRILILDEATASLHRDQVRALFDQVRVLAAAGVAVVFISHRLDEITGLCHRATILRSGKTIATVQLGQVTESELVEIMVGDVRQFAAPRRETVASREGAPVLAVQDLRSSQLQGVSFQAYPGEVIGLGGLQGQGQSALLKALFGAAPHSGEIRVHGQVQVLRTPTRARRAGIAYVPGDRGSEGTLAGRPILENLSIVSLQRRPWWNPFIRLRQESGVAAKMRDLLRIKLGRLADPIATLSGGNAQKVVLAKWLALEPDILLLDDPTKGVDIAAKAEIYSIIRDTVARGATVVLNSSDDVELVDLADRVLVMYEGSIHSVLEGGDVTASNLISAGLLIGLGDQDHTDASGQDAHV